MTNQQLFEQELLNTHRKGVDSLVAELRKTDFYTCACYGHDRNKGGTVNHSLWTLSVARNCFRQEPRKPLGISDSNLVMVCLLHDLGNIRQGFSRYRGHGRKSALILQEMRLKYGLDLSDAELSAIRFHRGYRIVDDFDRKLEEASIAPLSGLLRRADWVASGVMNSVTFGASFQNALTTADIVTDEVCYNPDAGHWYLDDRGRRPETVPTRHGVLSIDGLSLRATTKQVFGINLFHFSAYDLLILRNTSGKLAVFTVVEASMNFGNLYRSDHGGFCYKTVIVFHNRFGVQSCCHFILTEDDGGKWAIVSLCKGKESHSGYSEFIERKLIVSDKSSEFEALKAFRSSHHGIDLSNVDYYERFVVE